MGNMFLLQPRKLFLGSYSNCYRTIFMGSKDSLLLKSAATPATHVHIHLLHSSSSQTLFFYSNSRKNNRLFASPKLFSPSYPRASGYSYIPFSAMPIPRPISGVDVEALEKELVDQKQLMIVRQKLQQVGLDGDSYMPGVQYKRLVCPSCKGGDSHERSLCLRITENGDSAAWTCFRAKCGWKGSTGAFADVKPTYASMNKIKKTKQWKSKQRNRVIIEASLGLEPLCNELVAYFAERMISGDTLRRNAIMQKRTGDHQIAIAFPYRRNGELISCKYRQSSIKRFWQEANTEKIFYGLDDIKEASDIIIVEGEVDKLSMEEAGFKNCVSVPDGPPRKASVEALPSEEEDTRYQYVWNCKDYLDKASRIILATDGDKPGQALAEELARRLGKERCWLVEWPKKDEVISFKDANKVLKNLDADAIRDAIDRATSYQMQNIECWRVEWPKKDEVNSFKDANEVPKNLGADALRDAIDRATSYQMQNIETMIDRCWKKDEVNSFKDANKVRKNLDADAIRDAIDRATSYQMPNIECWRVEWPKKDEVNSFKDANKVLKNLDADAIRDAIDTAKSYQMQNLE